MADEFEFISPLDKKRYTLPPFDQSKFVDELAEHGDRVIPKASMMEILLTDTPEEGLSLLNAQAQAIIDLLHRSWAKTFRKHLPDGATMDAITALFNAGEYEVLGKVFRDWRDASGVTSEGDEPGEASGSPSE